MRPMLATAADPVRGLPDDGAHWAYEVKWDGMRALVDLQDGDARVTSRTERDITVAFPELQRPAHEDLLLDGEIVVLSGGVPSFAALAERIHVTDRRRAAALATRAPATLFAFDVLRLYGVDLMPRPWQERREALERVDRDGWELSPVHTDLEALVTATQQHGLEGVVAKRRGSGYRPGVRSPDWLKLAHRRTASCLVGGWRGESGGRGNTRIGALMIGRWDGDAFRFEGRVGSGLTSAAAQTRLRALLAPLAVDTSPFADAVPRIDALGTHWVDPQVVVEVRYLGRTEAGRLRQPVYLGVRADVDPADVVL